MASGANRYANLVFDRNWIEVGEVVPGLGRVATSLDVMDLLP